MQNASNEEHKVTKVVTAKNSLHCCLTLFRPVQSCWVKEDLSTILLHFAYIRVWERAWWEQHLKQEDKLLVVIVYQYLGLILSSVTLSYSLVTLVLRSTISSQACLIYLHLPKDIYFICAKYTWFFIIAISANCKGWWYKYSIHSKIAQYMLNTLCTKYILAITNIQCS